MIQQQSHTYTISTGLRSKLADYRQLVKFRLSAIVVFSAGIGYLMAVPGAIAWGGLALLMLGGFLITGAANALNEVIEKDYDKLMGRTANRPLPAGRMATAEALLVAGVMAIAGIFILAHYFNYLAALIGAISLLSYAFVYTPLKRITNFAVFVGAIPGALPPMIGWVAFTGTLSIEAFVLFAVQFLWQFPHFWAIAWVSHDDYKRAGFFLLPSYEGKTRGSAVYNILYIIFLIPVSLLPFMLGFTGWISAIIIAITGLVFLYQAFDLYFKLDNKAALRLMFGSFLYLPIVLLALVLDKL